MKIQRAREILGKKYAKQTDEEIQQIINSIEALASISIDTVLSMSPEKIKLLKSGIL